MSRNKKQWTCFLCDKLYAELEEAEMCERAHGLEHDAWCGCDECRAERIADTAEDYERERYADDGRDYSDPGDFLRGYED